MKNNKNSALTVASICLLVLLSLFFIVPDFLNYDINYKNEQLEQRISDKPLAENLQEIEFNLPVLYIKCDDLDALIDNSLTPRPIIRADVYVLDNGSNKLTDTPTHIYKDVSLTLRGASSAQYQVKKSFNLEFSDQNGNSLDMPFLSFDAESDFILYAPYIDRSLIRNYLGYELQRQALDWAPGTQFVEVFMDVGNNDISFYDYVGVYMVTEKIKKGDNRINIQNFTVAQNPQQQFENGGGYIYKLDWYDPIRDNVTRLERNEFGNEYSIVYPKPQNITDNDIQVIYNEIELYEHALYNGTDEELAKYFDLEQIARNMLISEFLKTTKHIVPPHFSIEMLVAKSK